MQQTQTKAINVPTIHLLCNETEWFVYNVILGVNVSLKAVDQVFSSITKARYNFVWTFQRVQWMLTQTQEQAGYQSLDKKVINCEYLSNITMQDHIVFCWNHMTM